MKDQIKAQDFGAQFEVFEVSEATALQEMGASSGLGAGSTCSGGTKQQLAVATV